MSSRLRDVELDCDDAIDLVWIIPSATRAWPVVPNIADSASAGIHGRPPVWLVGFQARSTS